MIKKPSMQSKLKTGDLPPIPDTTPNKTGKTPSKKIKKLGGKANRPPVSKNKTKKEKVKKPKGDKSGILGKLFKKNSSNLNEEYHNMMNQISEENEGVYLGDSVLPAEPEVQSITSINELPDEPSEPGRKGFSLKNSKSPKPSRLSKKGKQPKQPKQLKQKGDKKGILFKKGSRKDNRTVGLFKSGKDYNVEPEYILDEAILAGMEFYDSLHGITTPEEITIEDTTIEDTVVFIEEDIAEPIDLIEFPDIDEEPIVEDNSDIIVLDELPEENQKTVNISEQELISEDTEEEDIKFEDYLASDILSSKIYNIDEIED